MPVTDYIGIRGLEGTEAFQGIVSNSVSVGQPGEDTPGLDWGAIPDEAVSLLSEYTADMNAWLSTMQDYDPDTQARDLPAVIPAIPTLLATLATGGASLPAVATVFIGQTLINIVGTIIENYAKSFHPNSVEAILKKALIFQEEDEDKSVLNERLSDLAYVDQIIDFGAFRVHIRGKLIEH